MGYFIPAFLAFTLNSCGVYIFHDASVPGGEPLVSSLIFLFAVFLLVWDIRLFPTSLRKLWKCGAYIYQFLISAFLMEHIMNDFWFPLELTMLTLLPKIALFEEEVLAHSGLHSNGILQFLKLELAHVVASYILSFFFFFAILHSTRVIDLRLLRCGVSVFVDDVKSRTERELKKIKKMIGPEHPRNVKFRSRNSYEDNNQEYFDDNYCTNNNNDEDYKKGRRCRYY